MQTSELTWTGCGPKKLTFCFHGERELFLRVTGEIEEALALIPSAGDGTRSWNAPVIREFPPTSSLTASGRSHGRG